MIPEQAVDAAIQAAKESFNGKPPRGTRAAIKLALQAAAPHMLATNRPEKEVSTGTLIRKMLDEARVDG